MDYNNEFKEHISSLNKKEQNILEKISRAFLLGVTLTDGNINHKLKCISITQSCRTKPMKYNDDHAGTKDHSYLNTGKKEFIKNLPVLFNFGEKNCICDIKEYKGNKPNNTGVIPENITLKVKNAELLCGIFASAGIANEKTKTLSGREFNTLFDSFKTKEEKIAFIIGVLYGDGIWYASGSIGFCSKNKDVCSALQRCIKLINPSATFSDIYSRKITKQEKQEKPENENKKGGLGNINSFVLHKKTSLHLLNEFHKPKELYVLSILINSVNHKNTTIKRICKGHCNSYKDYEQVDEMYKCFC